MWRKIRVVDGDGCWEWQAYTDKKGYGRFTFNTFTNRTCINAHRAAYEMHTGKILPKNILVCHKCDNRKCCRPDHLFEGTAKDNMQDCSAKKRTGNQKKTHCKYGHPYDESNTYKSEWSKFGIRRCKICTRRVNREKSRRRKARKLQQSSTLF